MRPRILAVLCLTLIPLGVAISATGVKELWTQYRFEPEPQTPLAELGIPQSRDPKLALRASGAVYLLAVYGPHSESRLGLAVSNDGGDSFAPPVPVSAKGAQVSSHGENSPNLVSGPSSEFYALWEQTGPDGQGTNLMFARSLRFGRTFDEPIPVTDKKEPSSNSYSSLAVGPKGHIYAVWLDGRDRELGPPGTSAVYLAKSTDRGASFGRNVRVAAGICPCCRPTIAFGATGKVHVSWRHVFPGNIRDMALATSRDGGETFGEPVRVAKDEWKINGCPHSGASMLRQGARLFIAWYSDGDGGNPGVRVAWSDDSAQTFSSTVLASGEILDANHPVLTLADDGRILLVFQGRDPAKNAGWGGAAPYVCEVSPSGAVSPPQRVPGTSKSVSYPAAAGGTLGRVTVAWTEKTPEGQQQVHVSRGRPADVLAVPQ